MTIDGSPPPELRCATVIRVAEDACQICIGGDVRSARYAPQFPVPRVQRVSPGHLVAVAPAADGTEVVLWRWFDAVVLGNDGQWVRLWEPAHGEVLAEPRPAYTDQPPGSRAYASAGLPGAEWWVACPVAGTPEAAVVELAEVSALYTDNDLWPTALA